MEASRTRARLRARALLAVPIASALALAACPGAVQVASPGLRLETGPDAPVTHDGLRRVENARADLAFVKPGVDLRGYSKVVLDPVSIAYKRPQRAKRSGRAGDEFALSPKQTDQMKRYFQEAFEAELGKSQVYQLVSEPGPDVLRVRGQIVDLVVNVPPRSPSGPDRTFVASAGEMTLVLELSDSESGEVLARVADRRAARSPTGDLTESSPVSNWSEVRRMFARWARLLRERLDTVRELPALPAEPAALPSRPPLPAGPA
jgi:hypothetical protein